MDLGSKALGWPSVLHVHTEFHENRSDGPKVEIGAYMRYYLQNIIISDIFPTPRLFFFYSSYGVRQVHPTSYKMGTGGYFPGVKRQGREADHSPPASSEVKKTWIYTSTPPYAFMA
jgi:hypothetical protein